MDTYHEERGKQKKRRRGTEQAEKKEEVDVLDSLPVAKAAHNAAEAVGLCDLWCGGKKKNVWHQLSNE